MYTKVVITRELTIIGKKQINQKYSVLILIVTPSGIRMAECVNTDIIIIEQRKISSDTIFLKRLKKKNFSNSTNQVLNLLYQLPFVVRFRI